MIKNIIFYGVILIILYGLFFWLTTPFRHRISNRFKDRGIEYLSHRQYENSIKEFNKAKKFNKKNSEIQEKIELVQKTTKDLLKGKKFFEDNNSDLAKKITEASGDYPHAKAALEAGVSYLEAGDAQLALIAINRAIEIDPEYPDAYRIAKIAYNQLAENCSEKVMPDCKNYFKDQAKKSKQKLEELNPIMTK